MPTVCRSLPTALLIVACGFGLLPLRTAAAGVEISTGTEPGSALRLVGSRDRRQLVVTSTPGGLETAIDLTSDATWRVEPATLATVEPGGMLVPLADGEGTIVATLADAGDARVPLVVERFGDDPPVDFVSQIVPLFTKHGCNGGGCHGKSGGQNNFRLSLLGFEPGEDQEHLFKEARGRRISPAAPEQSLLLAKATAAVPHGGGRLIEPGSPAYDLLVRWIAEGAQPSGPNPPQVARIEVFPTERMMRSGQKQQLRVLAHYADGRAQDVTRLAQFESNAADLATVDTTGLVTAADTGKGPSRCGTAGIMVRYQSQVAVFRGTTPLDTPLDKLPKPEQFVRNLVDEQVLAQLVKLRLPPSPPCDDATFLRRVTIDIAGRLPTSDEARAFLADASPGKRAAAIDRLLDSPDYAQYFAMKWMAILRNKRTRADERNGTYSFHDWIRESFADNKPYDDFVRDLLTATGEMSVNPAVSWYRQARSGDILVEDSAQLFLGMRMQCAKCHHHPYENWGMSDYWQMAAFFSTIGRKPGLSPAEDMIFHTRGTPRAAGAPAHVANTPAVLGGKPLTIDQNIDPRQVLADWMVAPSNPFFAKSLANRYWKHFLGVGLVEPEDDMRLTNPATNPALLDALARSFADSEFDLKQLIRTICNSRTYQLSAQPNEFNGTDRQSYSRFFARRLPAEVTLDAIDLLTDSRTGFAGVLPGTRAVELPDPNFDSYFLTTFGRPMGESACECERVNDPNLAQSLHLVNSSEILAKVAGGRVEKLAAHDERPLAERVGDLYLIAVARPARPEELGEIERYFAARPDKPKEAWEDVVWSVLNSKEFLFNH
jgi:hypothetical protein